MDLFKLPAVLSYVTSKIVSGWNLNILDFCVERTHWSYGTKGLSMTFWFNFGQHFFWGFIAGWFWVGVGQRVDTLIFPAPDSCWQPRIWLRGRSLYLGDLQSSSISACRTSPLAANSGPKSVYRSLQPQSYCKGRKVTHLAFPVNFLNICW